MGVKVIRPSGWKDWYIQVCEGGKRFLRHVGSREAAYKAKKYIEGALASGAFVPPDQDKERGITLKEYADKWMAGHVAVNLKPATARYYRMNLDAHLLPALGSLKLSEITRDAVKSIAFAKAEKGIAKSYVHGIVRTLSAILNHAVEDGIITANVATRPGRFVKVPKDREWIVALTPVEAKHFLDTAKKAAVRYYPLFAAALFTGAR